MNYVTFKLPHDWLWQLDTFVIDLEKRNVFNGDVIFQHTYELFHFFLCYICTYLAKLLHAWIPTVSDQEENYLRSKYIIYKVMQFDKLYYSTFAKHNMFDCEYFWDNFINAVRNVLK